jgi:gas vesicle protein
MTLELIIFIICIIFGILLYWRESKSNKTYRLLNKLMYSKELQMSPHSTKGFIYEQNFLMRLVYISLLFIVAILISKLFLPIEIATIQLFVTSIVGTLAGTYLAGFIIKSSEVIEAQSDNFEDVVQNTLNKGKEVFDDLKNKDNKAIEVAKEEIKEEPEEEKKSARERLKDKGLM